MAVAPGGASSSPFLENHDDSLHQQQPLLPSLHLQSLPDPIHCITLSYLSNQDMLRLMETGPWALATYGGFVKELELNSHVLQDHEAVSSFLRHRPGLIKLVIRGERVSAIDNQPSNEDTGLALLFNILAEAACPKLATLCLPLSSCCNAMLMSLGDSLRQRMDKGCCEGIRSLAFRSSLLAKRVYVDNLSALLSSGALDGLEELGLDQCWLRESASQALGEWQMRTKAIHLLSMSILSYGQPRAVTALSSPGVAPRLRSLVVYPAERQNLMDLMAALERMAWPDLQRLRLFPCRGNDDLLAQFMETLRVGCPRLESLALEGGSTRGFGAMAVVSALRYGAFPSLTQLDLRGCPLGDVGAAMLARALDECPRYAATLRRLGLRLCQIGVEGMRELAVVLGRGACRSLEQLDFSANDLMDEGVVAGLAPVVEGGALPLLKELDLEGVDVGDSGTLALSRAIGQGGNACPCLERLDLRHNKYQAGSVRMLLDWQAHVNSSGGDSKLCILIDH